MGPITVEDGHSFGVFPQHTGRDRPPVGPGRRDRVGHPLPAGTEPGSNDQPIVSSRHRCIVVVEALSLGLSDPDLSPPAVLFEAAKDDGSLDALQVACYERSIERFRPLAAAHPNLLLFL